MERPVVWVTTSFPYGRGEQFIEAELVAWQRAGRRVIFLPDHVSGTRRDIPEGFEVDDSLARAWASKRTLVTQGVAALFDPALRHELLDLRARKALTPARARTALRAVTQARLVERALGAVSQRVGRIGLVYTYWLKPATGGAVRARAKGQVDEVIARSHNTDLYEHVRPLKYNALVRTLAGRADTVHVISEQGCRYLHEHYGIDSDRIALARLGVSIPDPSQMAPPGEGSHLDLVTISTLTPFKRLDLIIEAIALVAQRLPERTVRWRHFGDGPLHDEVHALAAERLGALGVEHDFRGLLPHDQLLAELEHPADLMINASTTEGVPVSIMEAAVRGIPCIATDVGATCEVVDPDSGYLVPESVTAHDLASRITALADDARTPARREAVRRLVVERFDATANFEKFVTDVTGTRV